MSFRDSEVSAMCEDLSNIFKESHLDNNKPRDNSDSEEEDLERILNNSLAENSENGSELGEYENDEQQSSAVKKVQKKKPCIPQRVDNSKYANVESKVNTGLPRAKSRLSSSPNKRNSMMKKKSSIKLFQQLENESQASQGLKNHSSNSYMAYESDDQPLDSYNEMVNNIENIHQSGNTPSKLSKFSKFNNQNSESSYLKMGSSYTPSPSPYKYSRSG